MHSSVCQKVGLVQSFLFVTLSYYRLAIKAIGTHMCSTICKRDRDALISLPPPPGALLLSLSEDHLSVEFLPCKGAFFQPHSRIGKESKVNPTANKSGLVGQARRLLSGGKA